MNNKSEIIKQIKNGIASLETGGQDFDMITAVFLILHQTINLLWIICSKEKVQGWKEMDDPSFYRFASQLKKGLELQCDYLNTISSKFSIEGDIIAQKITAYQNQINSLLEQEKTILKEAFTLIDKEDELRESSRRVNILLSKKNELETIHNMLSGIDIKALEAEVSEKEKIKDELENKYKPIIERKKALQNSIAELEEALKNISTEIVHLETVSGEAAIKITENIPQWLERIKSRNLVRKEKEIEYIAQLEKEVEELKETESKIQEHLKKSHEVVSLAMTNQEILSIHFEANKTIGRRFLKSLPDIQDELSHITDAVKKELTSFDRLLSNYKTRLEEIASQFKPIGIAG